MLNFDVFGGCVSRDLFEHESKVGDIYHYFARTSLVSQFSTSLNISQSKIQLDSNFQKRMVLNDLNKNFNQYLKQDISSNFIIFDFLVERFKLFKVGGSVYTFSNEYKKSALKLNGLLIDREEHIELFEKAVVSLSFFLNKYDKVFLNKFYHAYKYIDLQGNVRDFENIEYIENENNYLKSLYSIFQSHVDNLIVLESKDALAFEGHRWGLATYHFTDEFYLNTNKQIYKAVR